MEKTRWKKKIKNGVHSTQVDVEMPWDNRVELSKQLAIWVSVCERDLQQVIESKYHSAKPMDTDKINQRVSE